ncbi:P-loop containing nucleoside triphosphate hydrolase protein [Mollisia scopiformis]|uniref:p-loop containing nucleoside triphosphate hydrolase protein n=1 Tax=Mollisia scopiformis TaxID=149040 RepID=A0A194XB98_MOLSC|nr:P-loop containing nucleoside triphosphate hydrolase protein [Mollisia scopiformis]KUJ17445.1 P-loop containing nucleoside triphosphate hydrolase protein [Mollisia scopiformis]
MAPSAVENGHAAQEGTSSDVSSQLNIKTDKVNGHSPESAVPVNGNTKAEDISAKEEEPEEVTKVGMECGLKNLYQKEDDRGRHTWTDKYPDDLDEAAENEMTARYAILVRNKKSFDSRKKLEIDSIVVQSPLLKNVLTKVLKDYPGVTPTLKRLIFQAPFNPFVHRWTEFTNALDQQEDEETKKHLELLYKTLEAELKDTIAAKNDYIKNKVITFEHLWTIFQPGATLYTEQWGRDCGSKFSNGNYFDHPKYGPCYGVNSQKVEWDGDRFGYASCQHLILAFGGTMQISALDAFPLEFHPEQKKIQASLLKRGKLFEHYHGYHYKAYKAFAIGKDMCGRDIKVTVDSRVIIDTFAYGKFNPNSLPHLAPLKIKSKAAVSDEEDSEDEGSVYDSEDDDDLASHDSVAGKEIKRIPLSDQQLIHCSPLLKGYTLKTKRWLSFFVDSVSEIVWNSSAFANLVLPEDQKELILAFAESQVKYKDNFDDVISGKGKGIIMLLSGGPGIGKTLTAESVAENMRTPLYMMSAGDLGIKSSEVETSLTTILEMVAKWNAVLLLDECDVFLEARSAHDLERNKIVSIFLRTLEYYEGILFLTTNRVKNMDPAFQSRIHISMEYPGLDKVSRTQVWKNFLERGVKHDLSEDDIAKLADVEINGRQIKNVLKTGQLLACHKGVPLQYSHLKTVLNVERQDLELA